jgi:hypothetical protein
VKATGGRRSPVLTSAAAYFGIVFTVGFVLGALRVSLLVPRIGARWAELAEMPLMFIAIALAAGWIVRRSASPMTPRRWLLVGALALLLLLAVELLLAVVLAGRGIGDYIASRDPVSGAVYLAMLVVFAAMPWLRSLRRP